MIERTLLDRFETLVRGLSLVPAPVLIGVVEPASADDLPAVVVAIEESERLGNGLGQRSLLITDGALPWQAEIDLANPVLPADPSFSLLDSTRTRLSLPHGGLVRRDGFNGSLSAADIQVTVGPTALTFTTGIPGPGQFSADPLTGLLTLGTPLPPSGTLRATYVLGQWEQRVNRSRGVLTLSVLAASADAVRDLSNAVLAALDDPAAAGLQGVSDFAVTHIGSIAAGPPALPAARQRVVRFGFQFEQAINVPESSGGVIGRIPVEANVG